MRAGRTAAAALAVTVAVAAGVDVSAHRLDEYLQAARIAIDPDRVVLQLDLTPGVAVAGPIVGSLDLDGDGTLSAGENGAYVRQVLSEIALDLDGNRLQLERVTFNLPDAGALRSGEGTIRLQASAALPVHLSAGPHRLSYRNNHRRDVSVYLANALVPESDRVAVKAQLRDADQRDLSIAYTLRATPDAYLRHWWLLGVVCAAAAIVPAILPRLNRPARKFLRKQRRRS